MPEAWVRYEIRAELLADAHFGTGSGGGGIDALLARDRRGRPVIWASHVEGVLRDAARRLRDDQAVNDFFGQAGGVQQRALFTSLYASESPESHIWRSAARQSYDNRAPKDDTLRAIEFAPRGMVFVGKVELPDRDLPLLQRLVQEVDALGSGRASGAGRLSLSLKEALPAEGVVGQPTKHLKLLLKNCDPLCITATATPDNLIPSLAFVPGRALLGTLTAWLIAEGENSAAALLTSGRISVSDALPLPNEPRSLISAEVAPAPLSLQSEKPRGTAAPGPWWAKPRADVKRIDTWTVTEKLKRPEEDLFVYRPAPDQAWVAFRPARRVRLRNGRPDPKQADASLFAIEQIVEETRFLAELSGSPDDMGCLAKALKPILAGQRWLRIGRSGTPVEVVQSAWLTKTDSTKDSSPGSQSSKQPREQTNETDAKKTFRLTLTADLLVRDDLLRWRTALDEASFRALIKEPNLCIKRSMQEWVMVHGFNGRSRLWRMPAAAIRRGSVFEVSGLGVAELMRRAAQGDWLGERTHEGFGRFRLDEVLPGVTHDAGLGNEPADAVSDDPDDPTEAIAAQTHQWLGAHKALAKPATTVERKPSLAQWLDLVADLKRDALVADLKRDAEKAIDDRLNPTTVGARGWKHADAKAIVEKLKEISDPESRELHAYLFVRWLRVAMRKEKV